MSEGQLRVINEALGRLGSAPIFALDEDTDRARSCTLIYATEIDALFGAHRWNFAQRTVRLDRLDETPENGWRCAFALPGERVGLPVRVMVKAGRPDAPLRTFAIEGDRLYAEPRELWATFVMRVEPQQWLPTFRKAAALAVAAALAMPISEDRNKAESLREECFGPPPQGGVGGLVGRAIAEDVRGSPGPAPGWTDDPFTDAWRG